MRRFKPIEGDAIYHCISRTVNGERLFGDREKEQFRKMLWQVADFSGVEILTYCVLSNHFHLLVRVPEPGEITDSELMRRYRVLYPKSANYQPALPEVLEARLAAGGAEAEQVRARLRQRMENVSEFMRTLKLRFSIWFNQSRQRYGPLWSERFTSVLVQNNSCALQTIAAYIDLNPVRAGLVSDPRNYRFCGYAEAVAGGKGAIRGLARLWPEPSENAASAGSIFADYRMLLFSLGSTATREQDATIDPTHADHVLHKEKGALPQSTRFLHRIRYLSRGAVLGTSDFVASHGSRWQAVNRRKTSPKTRRCDTEGPAAHLFTLKGVHAPMHSGQAISPGSETSTSTSAP